MRNDLLFAIITGISVCTLVHISAGAGMAAPQDNAAYPLIQKWTGPYGAVPPFDKVRVADFIPAFDIAIAENLSEIDAIANNPAPPTFNNTFETMERAGETFNRVEAVYGVWSSTMSSDEFQVVQKEMEPKLAALADKIIQNEKLFKRIETVYNSPDKSTWTAEQQRLAWVYYDNFVRNGARLDPAAKSRLADINQQLASLYTAFRQNLLADETNYVLYLKETDLAGLPDSVRDAAATAAEEKGHKGEWAILNTRSSVDPFLTYSERRGLREKVWRTFYNRGDNGDAHDNNKIISEILPLRAERARLLGYPTHAHWRLANAMAKTPDNAMKLMMEVWPAAVARIREEVADMQALADKEGAGIKIEPWDYRYYAEKVRKAKYDLDMNAVKPYLQLDKLREAMFWVAGQLYGFQFAEVRDVPTAHPDIRVWEVKNEKGDRVGLWYFDPYARTGKRSGAWMNEYRSQQRLENITPIVSNNCNFVKGKAGEPVLISWTDAQTMFHEFGHALHGLNSSVMYPSLSGTKVARDFVELPSQINENWLSTPEVLSRFALHSQTGRPMPADLLEKIKKADTFNQGFSVGEYLAAALVDMKLHLAGDAKIDPDKFEAETLKDLGMPSEIVMRHRTPQFGHVFSSDGYAAGYYSYLWAEVLDHDAYAAFTEAGSPYDKTTAKRFKEDIMVVGNTIDPAQAFRNFRGRDPKIDGYLRAKDFPATGTSPAPN